VEYAYKSVDGLIVSFSEDIESVAGYATEFVTLWQVRRQPTVTFPVKEHCRCA